MAFLIILSEWGKIFLNGRYSFGLEPLSLLEISEEDRSRRKNDNERGSGAYRILRDFPTC